MYNVEITIIFLIIIYILIKLSFMTYESLRLINYGYHLIKI